MLSEGDVGDDDSDEEEEGERETVADKSGRVVSIAFDDALAVDTTTGDVAWGRLVDSKGGGRHGNGAESTRRCCKTMLPLGLLIFLLPALLLAPFYIIIYTTTIMALGNVVKAQVRTVLSCGGVFFFHRPSHTTRNVWGMPAIIRACLRWRRSVLEWPGN